MAPPGFYEQFDENGNPRQLVPVEYDEHRVIAGVGLPDVQGWPESSEN